MSEKFATDSTNVVYTNAEVLTFSDGSDPAEAIWIQDGRIAAVGTNEEVLSEAGSKVERQSLRGATIVPGLIDTHPHLLHFAGFRASAVDILDAQNHDDIVNAIKHAAEKTPVGEWILATPVGEPHYFHRRSWRKLREGNLPDRHVLDRATTDHPVMILAWAPVTPNTCAVNSAGLAALDIDSSTPDRISNVWIDKGNDGSPTGTLRGNVICYYNSDPYFKTLAAKLPLIRPELVPDGMLKAMASYNAQGITAIYESHAMEAEHIGAYQSLHKAGSLTLRVQAAPELECHALPTDRRKSKKEIQDTLQTALSMQTRSDDWLRIDGITAHAWGPCYGGFLYWKEGYQDAWGNPTTGQRMVSEESIRLAYEFCAKHGLRMNLCSLSPDEHDEHLALTTELMENAHLNPVGWLLENGGYMIRDDQIRRFAELGFNMTTSMSFTFGKGDMLSERIGPQALRLLNPLRHIIDAGLPVAASMDWGPTNPWEQMQLAVTHEMWPSQRRNNGSAQVITRAEAFDMWTAAGAKVMGWPEIGRISRGNFADIAIVDRNPVTCPIDALPATKVLRTLVGGRVVYERRAL